MLIHLIDGIPLYKVPGDMHTLLGTDCLLARGFKEGSCMEEIQNKLSL